MHGGFRVSQRIVRQENYLLAHCAAATVVSISWAKALHESSGVGSKLHVIPNGYDPHELNTVQPFTFPHFAIVYTGNFYPPKRVISPVMSALRELQVTLGDRCRPWYFHYYGREEAHVREEALRFGVMERVVLHGRVSRHEALSAIRGANLAVVITCVSNEASFAEQGMIPAKIFEALGLETPVLLICPPGADAAEIIAKTKAGAVFSGSEPKMIANFLSRMICSPAQINGSSAVQEWAWPRLIGRLDGVLRVALDPATTPSNSDVEKCST